MEAVTQCKLIFILFNGKGKKQEKEAGTTFALLYQLRRMIGQCTKTYLHRRIKALQFLPSWKIQKKLM